MRQDDEVGLRCVRTAHFIGFALQNCIDADTGLGQNAGDLSQHTCLIGYAQAQVIAGDNFVHRQDRRVAHGTGLESQMRHAVRGISRMQAGNVHQVGNHGAGCGFRACTLAVIQRSTHRVALHYHGVHSAFDIQGVDAAHKATIMSAIAFGIPVQFDKAYVEGITKLSSQDIKYAEQLGYRIKLLGIAKRRPEGIELRVHPSLVPTKRLIANVEGAMNAVMVQGDAVGTTLYYGKGAGSEPTASAVIADLVDITRLHTADAAQRVPHLAFQPNAMSDLPILPMAQVVTSYYLRLRVADQTGVLAKVTGILANADISIDAVLQRESDEVGGTEANQTDLIILTHDCAEARMDAALAQMQALPTVLQTIVRIRKEELA